MATGYNTRVTVILAGLCDDGAGAVLIADRMRTTGHVFAENEIEVDVEAVTKIEKLSDKVYIAHSGSEEFWTEILLQANRQIHPHDKPRKVRAILENFYRQQHRRWLEAQILVPLGYDSVQDYNARANAELPAARIDQIDRQLRETLGTGELILIGLENEGYEIYGLQDPGYFKFNHFGQAIAGSGARSATKLVVENHSKSMSKEEVKALLLEAKKLAEQDKGVGKLTQVVVLPEA